MNVVLRRAFESLVVILGIAVVVFLLAEVVGDPARLMLPVDASPAEYEAFREANGFNRPVIVRFGEFLTGLITFDFGDSVRQGVSASSLVFQALGPTLALALTTQFVAILVAIPVGTLAGMRPASTANKVTSALAMVSISVPTFWMALIGIGVFAVNLRWLPTSGYGTAANFVLPTIVLAIGMAGRLAEVVRASVQEQMTSVYVRTARSKGVSEQRVVFGHVLKNALIPVLTVAGDEFASLIGGATVVEVIFGWPGIGLLTVTAIQARDFPVVQASVLITGVAIVILNLVIDVMYSVLDPRVRRST